MQFLPACPVPVEELWHRWDAHIVASHHGKLEYGSPVVPKIPEALVIHQCDMIDANVEKMLKAREDSSEECSNLTVSFQSRSTSLAISRSRKLPIIMWSRNCPSFDISNTPSDHLYGLRFTG